MRRTPHSLAANMDDSVPPYGRRSRDSSLMGAEPRSIAITGAHTSLGAELIARLDADDRYDQIFALDIEPPAARNQLVRTEFVHLDLTEPGVDGSLATLLSTQHIDTVVHAAFTDVPRHDPNYAHELEDVGTMHVLNACAGAQTARLVVASSTLVYGASPDNPNFLTEDAELRGELHGPYIASKVRAERQVMRFASEHPECAVSLLRFAPVLGPSVRNLFTRFFAKPWAPVLLGRDPLMQFLHERDAITALQRAVDAGATGPINIVGKGVLPYTTVLAMMGRVPVYLPPPLIRGATRLLWASHIARAPADLLPYLRYPCVADGTRGRAALGFSPQLNIRRTILDFLGLAPEDGATDVAQSVG